MLSQVEETTGSLFSSDLFNQPGDQPAIVREDLSKQMCQFYREGGAFAAAAPVLHVVDRLEQFNLQWVHPMHGGSIPGEMLPRYIQALRSEPFAFEGSILGRVLP